MLCKIKPYKIFFIAALVLFVSACAQDDQSTPDEDATPDQPKTAPLQDQQEEQNEQENIDFVQNQPPLEGGTEEEVREPHPVSNEKLQRLYPDILVLRGTLEEDRVALTFDDGPDPRFTPEVLDVLEEYDVPATFFLVGSRVEEHPDLVNRIHEEGHAIGNHTYSHPNLPEEEEGIGRLQWEVRETEDAIADVIGFQPRHFRSPYGMLNEELVEALGEMNHTVVGWNVDSLDWKQISTEVIIDNVLSNTGPGSIILMHDAGDSGFEDEDLSSTARALDEIISKLQADGIEFVTVPELIGVPEAK
ncbi:peptidoglycan/xylan/chitin deacetylase (PgdA/CDA1 family) [Virgibacillus natechei]|uniref:Peptidoglycan/xylan/chitin deacetylase (PgdA/CDA1 family) n=1 Tax=Virgibacillus natechei TaxID=1216297 RepID=A0ABS4IHU7_9BACI|nr:polysaccharide deacetylase family protein [Virgibacillus natechei]MBP1970522.1 peptidoglycan/xylan/chitin deacetylase (PgdA/CDA1 family) [Virgibacillus natechei]UZD14075.1 polysaccharide deacetylase family protein [Virgibacillus natechei]